MLCDECGAECYKNNGEFICPNCGLIVDIVESEIEEPSYIR